MTREKAHRILSNGLVNAPSEHEWCMAFDMAIQALEQEPCELLIIKSDILLHQDDRKKWVESIKREKESGVIILPPYFEPLLVPDNIEMNIEQEPTDAISRDAVIEATHHCGDLQEVRGVVQQLPSVTQKSESVTEFADRCRECGAKYGKLLEQKSGHWIYTGDYLTEGMLKCSECGEEIDVSESYYDFCPVCGAKMESEVNNG